MYELAWKMLVLFPRPFNGEFCEKEIEF